MDIPNDHTPPHPGKGILLGGGETFISREKAYLAADAPSTSRRAGWRPIVTVETPAGGAEGRGGVVSQRLRVAVVSRGQAAKRRKPAPPASEAHGVRRRTQPPPASWSAQHLPQSSGAGPGGGVGGGAKCWGKISFSVVAR